MPSFRISWQKTHHSRKQWRNLFAVVILLLINCGVAFSQPYELVIKNGRVIDGSGNPWFYADLGISNGRIAKIGRIDISEAAEIIEAQNLIVAPGFIDVHAHVENSIMRMPTADNFLMMGVTTIITGNCGGSWLAIGDSLRLLDSKGVSINLATLVGHNTVRRAVMKEEARDPTPEELVKMTQLAEQARARQIRAREKIARPRRRHTQNDLAAGANIWILGSRLDPRRLCG